MMPGSNPATEFFRRLSPKDGFFTAALAALTFFLTAILGNILLLSEFLGNAGSFSPLLAFQLFISLLWNGFSSPLSLGLALVISSLFALNVLLLRKSARWQNLFRQKIGLAGLASAVLGIGCLACSAILPVAAASFLGAGLVSALLPYSSVFFQGLALVLLSLSLFFTLRVSAGKTFPSRPAPFSRKTKLAILAALALCLLFLSVVFYRSELGSFFWSAFRAPGLAAFLAPNDPALHFAIGQYYFEGKKYNLPLARQHFLRAVELDERYPGAHYQLSRVYFIENRLPDALNEINKELAYVPEVKRSYYVRGLIYGYMELLENAAQDFETFLKWKPDSWAGHNDLAWIYFRMGEYEKSLAVSEAGLRFNPDNVWLLNSRGVALMNLGRKKEAKEALEKALAQAEQMGPLAWGRAYPGNNPSVYGSGVRAMRQSIQKNLELLQ